MTQEPIDLTTADAVQAELVKAVQALSPESQADLLKFVAWIVKMEQRSTL